MSYYKASRILKYSNLLVTTRYRGYKPFNAQEDTGVPFHRNFNSILRRDHPKISYERRAYESVDEKSLS